LCADNCAGPAEEIAADAGSATQPVPVAVNESGKGRAVARPRLADPVVLLPAHVPVRSIPALTDEQGRPALEKSCRIFNRCRAIQKIGFDAVTGVLDQIT
jgi:hypothetical protein